MPAPLEELLHAVTSGNTAFSPEQLRYYGGGDNILAQLRKYDPNAQLSATDVGGGEGGNAGGSGFRLDFDQTKMPTSKAGQFGFDLRPSDFGKLKNPNAVQHDTPYGDVTNSKNVMKPTDPLWVKVAPLVVAAIASMGAALPAAAAAEGVGAGAGAWGGAALADSTATGVASGLTSAATGSGLTGINTMGMPNWLIQAIGKSPQLARQIGSGGGLDPKQLAMMLAGQAGGAAGLPMNEINNGLTLASFARRRGL